MKRVTVKYLEAAIRRLNEATNSPIEPYSKTGDGRIEANIGCYHLSEAYGGYQLQRICNAGGGVTTPLGLGYASKRELLGKIYAFIDGHETANGEAK
jgi:hypothetical protein